MTTVPLREDHRLKSLADEQFHDTQYKNSLIETVS